MNLIDYSFYTLKVIKDSDGLGIKILIVITCHWLLDRTEIVKKFIDEFNNFVYLSIKASKKVVEILIDNTDKNLFRISQQSEFTKIATLSFYFYYTNLSEFSMDIMYAKIAKLIYQIRSRINYYNTLPNQLGHTKRVRVSCVFRKQSGSFLVRHWRCAYSIRNFVRISCTH